MLIDVHITHEPTGERAVYRDFEESDTPEGLRLLGFMWGDGNFACDCNRGAFFASAKGADDPDCNCGSEVYRVTIVERGTDRVLYQDEVPRR